MYAIRSYYGSRLSLTVGGDSVMRRALRLLIQHPLLTIIALVASLANLLDKALVIERNNFV